MLAHVRRPAQAAADWAGDRAAVVGVRALPRAPARRLRRALALRLPAPPARVGRAGDRPTRGVGTGPYAGPVTSSPPGRVYGGRTADERRAERRERLVDAGLEIFGTVGWQAASVERLCQVAGVATRSFYEEYADREALLLAVYSSVLGAATAAVDLALTSVPADLPGRVGAGLSTYVGFVTDDPRRARVVHREVRVAGVLEDQRRAAFLSFALLVEREAGAVERRPGAGRLTALALAGAVNELLIDWVATPEPRPAVAPLVDELVLLFLGALR